MSSYKRLYTSGYPGTKNKKLHCNLLSRTLRPLAYPQLLAVTVGSHVVPVDAGSVRPEYNSFVVIIDRSLLRCLHGKKQ